MTRGALRFTEEQFRAHREKIAQRPPEDSSRPLLPARGAPTTSGGVDGHAANRTRGGQTVSTRPALAGTQPGPLTKRKQYQPEIDALCDDLKIGRPLAAVKFHPHRKWEFDFAWPYCQIALEVEGGIWKKGGGAHSHPLNIVRDLEKYNAATLLGWRLIRAVPEKLADGVKSVRLLMLA